MNTFGIQLFDTSVRPITIIDRSGNEEDLPLSISIDKVEYQKLVTSEFEVLNQHSLSNLTFPITTTGALTTDSLTITGDGIINIHSETGMLKFNSEVSGEQQTIQAVEDNGFRFVTSASETNSVNTCLQIYNISEGSVSNGFGGEMLFINEADNGLFNTTGKIQFISTDVSASTDDSKFSFHLTQNGTTAEKMSLSDSGDLVTTGTITDGSGNVLGSGGGASALNDLSDVSYSSGDLTITGLDKIIADDIVLDSSADITLDASSGNFIAKKGGVEFSVANSAYAGMILGYTYLHPTTTLKSYEIQNAITVEDDVHKITFKTPPSQKVEIEVTALINCSSTDTRITVGLSSANATDGYSAVAGQFEYDSTGIFFTDDEVDDQILTFKFVVESANLAAVASDNTFWIGFGTAGATKTAYLQYGYRSTHGIGNHPFIIKATALPATIYDGT